MSAIYRAFASGVLCIAVQYNNRQQQFIDKKSRARTRNDDDVAKVNTHTRCKRKKASHAAQPSRGATL